MKEAEEVQGGRRRTFLAIRKVLRTADEKANVSTTSPDSTLHCALRATCTSTKRFRSLLQNPFWTEFLKSPLPLQQSEKSSCAIPSLLWQSGSPLFHNVLPDSSPLLPVSGIPPYQVVCDAIVPHNQSLEGFEQLEMVTCSSANVTFSWTKVSISSSRIILASRSETPTPI